jgi:hypothetical protein
MLTPAAIHSPLLDVSNGMSYFKSVVLIEEQVDVSMPDLRELSLHGVERTAFVYVVANGILSVLYHQSSCNASTVLHAWMFGNKLQG